MNKIAFQSNVDHPRTGHIDTFCFCDLDLDPMTLINEFDLDILKTYLCTEMKFLGRGFQKLLEHEHDRQTNRQTDRQTRPNALARRIRGC